MSFLEVQQRARQDPAWFYREVLGVDPWPKQVEICESVRDNFETSVASCHSTGKSWNAARLVAWFIAAYGPDCKAITTAPTDRQVKGILWKELRQAVNQSQYPLGGNLLQQEWALSDDWFAIGFTAPDYDESKVQGWHAGHVLVVVDEACGVSEHVYDGLSGVVTNPDACRVLSIGNPTDPNTHFGRNHKGPDVSCINISCFDTPNFTHFGIKQEDIADGSWEDKVGEEELPAPHLVTPAWVANRYRKWGANNPLYVARCLGQFPDTALNTLIPLSWIQAAQERHLEPGPVSELSVDVARFGDDWTVIGQRQGPVYRSLARISKARTTETTGHILRHASGVKPVRVRIDAVGVGGGVADQLVEDGTWPVTEINFGEKAVDDAQYANYRAECYYTLRDLFEAGEIDIDPEDTELEGQLAALTWKPDSKGRITLERKEDMKKRGLPSPDDADTLAGAYAPVKHETTPQVF